jgi:uncharacterized membrane protein
VPRREVIELDITVESAMTLIMSAGLAQPGGADPQRKLAALANAARLARAKQAAPPIDHPARISLIASSRPKR